MGSDERGVIERAGDGAIPGVFVGFSVAASRAYLESRTLAEKSAAATAAAMASKTPPTAEALRALRPKVRLPTNGAKWRRAALVVYLMLYLLHSPFSRDDSSSRLRTLRKRGRHA